MSRVTCYGRLVYIEPNDIASGDSPLDNVSWEPEQLNMSVDLQVVVPGRNDYEKVKNDETIILSTINWDDTSNVGRYVSFVQGSDISNGKSVIGHELTTDYINATYSEVYKDGKSNKECLGIESIDITFDSHFYPIVNIKFIDVRGFSLMMPAEEEYLGSEEWRAMNDTERSRTYANQGYTNFFRSVFHFPYPRFLLTIKGFFGNPVTFMLAVNEFKNNFNSQTGNFEVNISFIGYMYGLYTDIPLNMLIAAPYYGITANRDSNTDEVCDYWSGRFAFDGGYGNSANEVCTFIQLIKRYNQLEEDRNHVRNGTSANDALNRLSEIDRQIEAIDAALDAIRVFASETINENANSAGYVHYQRGYDCFWYCYGGLSGQVATNQGINIKKELWNTFVTAWNSCNEINTGLETPKWTPSTLFDIGSNQYKTIDNDTRLATYECWFEDNGNIDESNNPVLDPVTDSLKTGPIGFLDISHSDSESRSDLAEAIMANAGARTSMVAYIFPSYIIEIIEKKKQELIDERTELEPRSTEELEIMYNTNLGFDPFILNVYRMIFAHVDTFMYHFYSLLSRIANQGEEREFQHFDIDLSNTDLNKKTKKTTKVPPFPALYKIMDGNRRVEVFPETLGSPFSEMEEVKFVNDMINGVFHLKTAAVNELRRASENNDFNSENENASDNFFPTAISDMWHVKNPWSYIESDIDSIMTALLFRLSSSSYQLWIRDDHVSAIEGADNGDTQRIEALSFYRLHQQGVGEQLMAEFQSLKTEEGVKSFFNDEQRNYIDGLSSRFNNGNEVAFEKADNGIIADHDAKIPIYFTTINPSASDFVTRDTEGSDKLSKLIVGNEFEKVNSFRLKIMNLGRDNADYEYASQQLAGSEENTNTGRIHTQVQNSNIGGASQMPNILKGYNNKYTFRENWEWFFYRDQQNLNIDGKFFFSDKYKSYNRNQKATVFLLALNNALYCKFHEGRTNEPFPYVFVGFGEVYKTSITKTTLAPLLLTGCILKHGNDSGYANSGTSGIIYDLSDNAKYQISHFSDIKSRPRLKKLFTDAYDRFVSEGGLWDEVERMLTDKNNYLPMNNGNYEMSDVLKEKIYNSLISESVSVYIYFIDDEFDSLRHRRRFNYDKISIFFKKLCDLYGDSQNQNSQQQRAPSMSSTFMIDSMNAFKLSLYNSLKNLYDKWICAYDRNSFYLRTPENDVSEKKNRYENAAKFNFNGVNDKREFDNFIFVDCFYNDISYKYKINPSTIVDIIVDHIMSEANYSVYEFMADIAQKNRMLFQALPVYNNFYSSDTIKDIFSPSIDQTMKAGFGSTYVSMYTYEVSHVVGDDRFEDHMNGDYIGDLNDITNDPSPTDKQLFNYSGEGLSIKIPAFGVTYARQNQSYFKNIDVNMDNPRVTDYSIANLFALTNPWRNGDLNTPHTIANDIYSIYANRSYNCSVDMMGCANIMPMMYFQLNNIPMFRGAYMITNVEHHIKPGDFTTRFTGVRIAKNQLPYNDTIYSIERRFADGSSNGAMTRRPFGGQSGIPVCSGFDIDAVIARMNSYMDLSSGTDISSDPDPDIRRNKELLQGPVNNTEALHQCGRAVRFMLIAGFRGAGNQEALTKFQQLFNQRPNNGGSSYPYGNEWDYRPYATIQHPLQYLGFEEISVVPSGVANSDCNTGYSGKTWLAGDVCTSDYNDRNSCNHVCIYNGTNWVSDFRQNNMNVYGTETGCKLHIYRFRGCHQRYTAGGTGGSNMSEAQRGVYLIKELVRVCGFTLQQAIGVATYSYIESFDNNQHWNPKADSENRTKRDSGIAQWVILDGRQKGVCNYLNNTYHTNYAPCTETRSGEELTVNTFTEIPFERQVEAMTWEFNNRDCTDEYPANCFLSAKRQIMSVTTAKDACDQCVRYYGMSGNLRNVTNEMLTNHNRHVNTVIEIYERVTGETVS